MDPEIINIPHLILEALLCIPVRKESLLPLSLGFLQIPYPPPVEIKITAATVLQDEMLAQVIPTQTRGVIRHSLPFPLDRCPLNKTL